MARGARRKVAKPNDEHREEDLEDQHELAHPPVTEEEYPPAEDNTQAASASQGRGKSQLQYALIHGIRAEIAVITAARKSKTKALEKRVWQLNAPAKKPAKAPPPKPSQKASQAACPQVLAARKYRAPNNTSSEPESDDNGGRSVRESQKASTIKNQKPQQAGHVESDKQVVIQQRTRAASDGASAKKRKSSIPRGQHNENKDNAYNVDNDFESGAESPASEHSDSSYVEESEDGENTELDDDLSDKDSQRSQPNEPPISPSPSPSPHEDLLATFPPPSKCKKRATSHRSDDEVSGGNPVEDERGERSPDKTTHPKKKRREYRMDGDATGQERSSCKSGPAPSEPHAPEASLSRASNSPVAVSPEQPNKPHPASGKCPPGGVGKRQRKYDEEVPQWSEEQPASKRAHEITEDEVISASARKKRKHQKSIERSDARKASESEGNQADDPSNDERIDLVYKKGSRLGMLEQRLRVRKTLNAAIFMCQADILIRNAFPDSAEKYNTVACTALVRSADDLGFKNLVKRLKVDDDYAFALAAIPVDRIPLFCSRACDAINGALRTTYNLDAGDVTHVNWLLKGCHYIYPHDDAVFAAIDDNRTNPYEASEFTTNFFANAYFRNMRILSELKDRSPEGYHDLMHDLFETVWYATSYPCNPPSCPKADVISSGRGAIHTGARQTGSDDDLAFLDVRPKART
ncbi:hypothetical protein NUW54_g1302 [Trametes sanguinea]|uniref:Uncharacterized protein n=1 Tax=Trametes sanguinea TaxID=158606 RepID=A0ACC1Q9W3_9APHY|nr:hypothetical protein NUW54_g1302 [Trametes sanguinea]